MFLLKRVHLTRDASSQSAYLLQNVFRAFFTLLTIQKQVPLHDHLDQLLYQRCCFVHFVASYQKLDQGVRLYVEVQIFGWFRSPVKVRVQCVLFACHLLPLLLESGEVHQCLQRVESQNIKLKHPLTSFGPTCASHFLLNHLSVVLTLNLAQNLNLHRLDDLFLLYLISAVFELDAIWVWRLWLLNARHVSVDAGVHPVCRVFALWLLLFELLSSLHFVEMDFWSLKTDCFHVCFVTRELFEDFIIRNFEVNHFFRLLIVRKIYLDALAFSINLSSCQQILDIQGDVASWLTHKNAAAVLTKRHQQRVTIFCKIFMWI